MKIIFTLVAVTVGSYFITLSYLSRFEPVRTSAALGGEMASVNYWLEKLRDCSVQGAGGGHGGCSLSATQLALSLRQIKSDKLRSNRSGLFHIFLFRNNLIYLKENCKPADIAVDMFPVNYYPEDVSLVPEARKKPGLYFLNQAVYFKKAGYQVDGACLLLSVLKVNGDQIKRLTTGQYQMKKGWNWTVDWILSKK